ncbi:MAG TPA: DUF2127 domain-containing protein, partial [Pirellulales bacterium]
PNPPLPRRRHDRVLLAIAVFKYVKSALLIAVALGALKLLHHSFSEATIEWVKRLTSDPEHQVLHDLLHRALAVDDRTLRAISAGSFFYATLLAIEGTGLWLERRWGEYFTIIITSSFIPMELLEVGRRPGVLRIAITTINIAAVAYLVVRLRRENRRRALFKIP